jgi:hypothetical protein
MVRFGPVNSRVLVQAEDGLFYVWRVSSKRLPGLPDGGSLLVSADELEMATDLQVVIGRHNRGVIPVGSVEVQFHGVVQRGKRNFRVLVTEVGGKEYLTAVVPVGDLPEKGGLIKVDRRQVFEARDDQVAAGLGVGKLRRRPRKAGGGD